MTETAADRAKTSRQRRRDGYRCTTIELHQSEIDALIVGGFLLAEVRDDPRSLAVALGKLFDAVPVASIIATRRP